MILVKWVYLNLIVLIQQHNIKPLVMLMIMKMQKQKEITMVEIVIHTIMKTIQKKIIVSEKSIIVIMLEIMTMLSMELLDVLC